ncbi:hypothetical protein ACFO0N_14240 [Halobium salinum]|uniref:Uncharacterized protein n=1 Tax=Halobium salinum TaxID=1364940 RepID=A0ABD5PDZ0_9EURY|nr:hypothetical protein [Halobium salinum]
MTHESTTHRYSGDVTLAGGEAPPVALHGTADSFVRPNAVEGNLDVKNAEYVFTGVAPDGAAGGWAPETEVRGDIEDGYVDPGGVAGDLRISGAEGVFVARDGVEGDLRVSGAENVFDLDRDEGPEADPAEYDLRLDGWEQSGRVEDPTVGASISGARGEVRIEKAHHDLEIYVVGHHNEVVVEGREATVTVHLVGYENEVSVGPYLSAEVGSEAGFDNRVEEAPYPAADLVETTRSEAFSNAGVGRRKVTFQRPVDGEEGCGNCGEPADAVIERLQLEAFFLFGRPLKTYDRSANPTQECEHCSPNAVNAAFTAEECRNVLG